MSDVITVKQGDTAPAYLLALSRDGQPLDLTDADVVARYRLPGPPLVVEGPVDVHDAASGQVVLGWPDGTLDRAGTLRVVLVASWADGRRITSPSSGHLLVTVSRTLEETA
jgi:hypothetical protein